MIAISDEIVISLASIFVGLVAGLFFLRRGLRHWRGTPWPFWAGAYLMYSVFSLGNLDMILTETHSVWVVFLTATALSLSFQLFFLATGLLNSRVPRLWILPVTVVVVAAAVFGLHAWIPDVRWAMPELLTILVAILSSVNAVEWISHTNLSLTSRALSTVYFLVMAFSMFMLASQVVSGDIWPWHMTDVEIEAVSLVGIAYILLVTIGIFRIFLTLQNQLTDRQDLRDLAVRLRVSPAAGVTPREEFERIVNEQIETLREHEEHGLLIVIQMMRLREIGIAYGRKYRAFMRDELVRLLQAAIPDNTILGEIDDTHIGLMMSGATKQVVTSNIDYLTKSINQASARSASGVSMEIRWSGAELRDDIHTFQEFYHHASEWLLPGHPRGIKQPQDLE